MLFKCDNKKKLNARVQTTFLLRGFGRRQKFQNVITARNGVTANNPSHEGEERRPMPMMDVGVFEGGPNVVFFCAAAAARPDEALCVSWPAPALKLFLSCVQGQGHRIPPAQQWSRGRLLLPDRKPLHGPPPLGYGAKWPSVLPCGWSGRVVCSSGFLDSRGEIVLCAFGKTWLAPTCRKNVLDHLVTQETPRAT